MTKLYELPNERRFIADVDKDTWICNVTEPQLDILISDLNGYAEMCEHAISLDKVKQAREEIENLEVQIQSYHNDDPMISQSDVLEILDKLTEESEDKE